jgi:hypothetical protein
MIELAQNANQASGIERLFNLVGALAGIDPAAADNVDIDYGLDKISHLYNNDPKLIRSPAQLAQIRAQRAQQAQQAQLAQQADTAQKLAGGAKTLSEANPGSGSLMTKLTGAA